MSTPVLVSVAELQALQAIGAPLCVFDCTSDLMNPAAAIDIFESVHIAGALHAHLDRDLSDHGSIDAHGRHHASPDAQSGGRHPLPSRERFAHWLSQIGFSQGMRAVVYDRNGANYCGRLWWMLKWCGHEAVSVLDGGLQAWQAAGGAVASGPALPREPGDFRLGAPLRQLVSGVAVASALGTGQQTLIDARAPARYRGEVEPLDPVAGHIPGALNRPFADNLGPDGRFKPPQQLRAEFEALLQGRAPDTVVHHCGSGVSALPNMLGMELAGFGPTGLYAGSWSEWCRDPKRPVARGAEAA